MDILLIIAVIALLASAVPNAQHSSVHPHVIIVTESGPEPSSSMGCLQPLILIVFVLFLLFTIT